MVRNNDLHNLILTPPYIPHFLICNSPAVDKINIELLQSPLQLCDWDTESMDDSLILNPRHCLVSYFMVWMIIINLEYIYMNMR